MQSTIRRNRRSSMLWTAVFVVLVAVAAESCRGARSVPAQAAAADPSGVPVKAPGQAVLGDRTTCAMHKGATFTVAATTPKVEYEGRTYYFCCEVCAKKFAEHPTDYIR